MKTYNWGIIGPGRIARKFAQDLKFLPNAKLHAVASTSLERATAFAAEFDAPHAYGRYEDILHCPGLDVVYVATPHVLHCENTLLCLENGIPVLCEKPFAMDAAQARRMVAAAHKNRVFLMEALWTLFVPGVRHAFDLVASGEIGNLHTIKSDFGFHVPFDPNSRLFNKTLGGGSLLDIGIYPALLALALFGKPADGDISANATFGPSDVDESCAFTFQYPGNRLAISHSTVAANTPIEATLYGTKGSIHMHRRFIHATKLSISKYDNPEEIQEVDIPYEGWGYRFEAAHVMECLDKQLLESPIAPLELTLDLVETLDSIRAIIGLEY